MLESYHRERLHRHCPWHRTVSPWKWKNKTGQYEDCVSSLGVGKTLLLWLVCTALVNLCIVKFLFSNLTKKFVSAKLFFSSSTVVVVVVVEGKVQYGVRHAWNLYRLTKNAVLCLSYIATKILIVQWEVREVNYIKHTQLSNQKEVKIIKAQYKFIATLLKLKHRSENWNQN